MTVKNSEKDNALIEQIKDRFQECEDFYGTEYERGREDVEFALGSQWDETSLKARKNRPCLTENHMLPFVNQVVNSIRQARPTVNVKPVDSNADVEVAEIMQGLIKNIEVQCDAESAYDTAAQSAITSGYGFVRVYTDYIDDLSFEQEIRIERILDFNCVYIDPRSKRLDGSDAEYEFQFEDIPKDEFEEAYPNAEPVSFKGGEESPFNVGDEEVRVAEYFYKDYETKTLYQYTDGFEYHTTYEKPEEDIDITSQREVEVCTVKYVKTNGVSILERSEWPSYFLPIVPVVGYEAFVEGKRRQFSLINQAKDPQRMLNYWKSASAEVVALQPKSPYIGYKGQFKSQAQKWNNANNANYAYLEADPVVDKATGAVLPLPQRQQPPSSSGSLMQEAMMAGEGIRNSLGMYDASMGQQTNDISGKAIISRQVQGDNATYHFVDNLSTALKQVGRIIVDLIPKIYSNQRIVRILGEDGVEKMMPINMPAVDMGKGNYRAAKLGESFDKNYRMDAGRYDVVIEVGSSYATRRQEAANSLIELARLKPELLNITGDLLVKSLDIPNGQEISERIRSTMPPELLGDDIEAERLQQMASQVEQLQVRLQETEVALQVKQNNDEFKNSIEWEKVQNAKNQTQIEASKVMAEINKMQADAEESRADAQHARAQAANEISEVVEKLNNRVEDMAGAIDVLLVMEEDKKATGEPESPVI